MNGMDILFRLLLALLFGGVIGFERERQGRAAGFRTHILVCVGACLVMCLGLYLAEQYPNSDPSRIAAHVISGIGFLGAGTILRFRVSVRGLTTAASLWTVSVIGLAVGAGFYLAALLATGAVLVTLYWLNFLVDRVMTRRDWYRMLLLEMTGSFEGLQNIREILAAYHAEIKDFNIEKKEGGTVSLSLDLRLLSPRDEEPIAKELSGLEDVKRAVWK